jgi:hypothetical protein
MICAGAVGCRIGKERTGITDQDLIHLLGGQPELGQPRQDALEYVCDRPFRRNVANLQGAPSPPRAGISAL